MTFGYPPGSKIIALNIKLLNILLNFMCGLVNTALIYIYISVSRITWKILNYNRRLQLLNAQLKGPIPSLKN